MSNGPPSKLCHDIDYSIKAQFNIRWYFRVKRCYGLRVWDLERKRPEFESGLSHVTWASVLINIPSVSSTTADVINKSNQNEITVPKPGITAHCVLSVRTVTVTARGSQDLNPGLTASKTQSHFTIFCSVFSLLVANLEHLKEASALIFKAQRLQSLWGVCSTLSPWQIICAAERTETEWRKSANSPCGGQGTIWPCN